MRLPSIHTIRISLAEIDGALLDDPSTSPVDTGKMPCVQIHDPERGVQPPEVTLTPSDDESDETDTDEASIFSRFRLNLTIGRCERRYHNTPKETSNANDEQWHRFSPKFCTGLGFNPDCARGPFPPGYRAPHERWDTSRASSWACGTDAGGDRRPGRATERPKPNHAFGRGGDCFAG